jgi:hypothetical protein
LISISSWLEEVSVEPQRGVELIEQG